VGVRDWHGQQCAELVAALPIPTPFTIEALVAELGERRGREIRLMRLPRGPRVPHGLLIRTDDTDFIGHAAAIAGLHREHIVLHELGHLLHADDGEAVNPGILGQLRNVLPDLSPELIRRLLTRTSYDDRAERCAELFATMAAGHIARHRTRTDALWRDGWISPMLFELSSWRGLTRG
jgi:hypothetical protein